MSNTKIKDIKQIVENEFSSMHKITKLHCATVTMWQLNNIPHFVYRGLHVTQHIL